MRVYEIQKKDASSPDGLDALTLTERPTPRPLGHGDVRVRVRAVSLNYRDLIVAKGGAKRAKPVIPASDGAGEVVEVGEGVRIEAMLPNSAPGLAKLFDDNDPVEIAWRFDAGSFLTE